MLPETIYCYEINFIVTSKSRALMKQLIVMDQLWHLVRELSRGFVLCLFTLASETILQRHHNAFFYTEIDDHGVHQGNTGQIIARWRRPVAYKVALNMLSRAMHSSPHWRIVVVVKMANDGNTFVRCCRLFCLTNCSKITLIVIIN
jgi:hypothetical protein